MMKRVSLSAVGAMLIVFTYGCGGDGDGHTEPELRVLTTLELTPATADLFTVAPGNSTTLTVTPKDQDGQVMTGLGPASFSTSDAGIATVDNAATVSAVAPGTAQISASLTVGGETATATMQVTVQEAAASASVVAPGLEYIPGVVDVQAGGEVTWTAGAVDHTVTFTTPGAPAEIPFLQESSESRTFPSNGSFSYRCTIHPGMTGIVNVH
jgi:plastocyanin